MQMIRDTAESVMSSLRALLTLLMNQVATQVSDQEVPAEHALQMHQLMVEVNTRE